MIEDFSGGYYRTRMTVQPVQGGPSIERGLFDFINREFYYQTDAPITMRVGFDGAHFRPTCEGGMPTDVLGLPEDLCERVGVHPSAEDVSVFILKPAHAYLYGQAAALGESPDYSNISDMTLDEEDERFFNLEG
jgi:hypothetical protein